MIKKLLLFFACFFLSNQHQNVIASSISLFGKSDFDTTLVKQYLDIGDHFKTRNADSGIFYYHKALSVAERKDTKNKLPEYYEALIYSKFASLYVDLSQNDSAYIYANKTLDIAKQIKDNEIQATAYNCLGALNFKVGNLDKALSYYTFSKKIYKELNKIQDLIKCENNIANIYYMRADYVEALERYNKVAEKSVETNNQAMLGKAYHNIGEVYYNISANEEAINYFFQSLKIREKLKDKKGIASDYISIGKVQVSNENQERALEYFNKAKTNFGAINNKPGLAKALHMIGNAYIDLNKPDSVIFYLEKAKELAIKTGEDYTLSGILFSFAQIYLKTKDYKNALLYFNETIELNKQLEDIETRAIATQYVAGIYNILGGKSNMQSEKEQYYRKAIRYADMAFQTGKENNYLSVKADAAKELKNAYEGLGNLKQAMFYYDIYTNTIDSLHKREKSEAAIYAEARWQAEKKQTQIKLLEQDKKLKDELLKTKETENKTQKAIIFLLIAGLLIILASAAIIVYFIRKQRKLEFRQQLHKISMLRLENARGRISPHFLFNSLTTIQDELSDKPDASKRLHAIVNMLRSSLLNVEKPYITLKEEIGFVENYILLQKSRIDHLKTEIKWDNEYLGKYNVPAMIVQIPVENAIKHGLAAKIAGDKILKIHAWLEKELLRINIIDNGIGRENARLDNKMKGTGTGLKVISQTIHLLNSKNQNKMEFSLIDMKDETGESCGTKVDISVPVAYKFEI